jgi:2-alkenal reductase
MVVAIGNPFRLSNTMTLGIISAKGRVLDSIRTTTDQSAFSAGDVIQTDASINPGNSGGPLLNLSGEVVGINRAIQVSGTSTQGTAVNSGIGFAVSINIVKRVVPNLIKDGHYDYPYMGISSSSMDLTLDEWKALGFTQTSGAYIMSITPGGPAEKAGLRGGTQSTSIQGLYAGGDLITAVDGHPVLVYGDIISYIFLHKSPGDQIVLTIIRNGQQKEVTLTLGKRP